jgi:hypothetical protein
VSQSRGAPQSVTLICCCRLFPSLPLLN